MRDIIRFVEITFENMDSIKIPIQYFRRFLLKNITIMMKPDDYYGSYFSMKVGNTYFELDPLVEFAARSFKGEWLHKPTWNNLLERLRQNDITALTLYDMDGANVNYSVFWENVPDYPYQNQHQRVTTEKECYAVSIAAPKPSDG